MLGPGYSVQINPADFTTRINNAWFPLKPGTRFVYSSTKDRSPSDVMTVTRRTAVLDSVLCVVVHDYVYESGKLSEKTNDYYAQNKDGSVWYFGEDAFDAGKHGKLTLSPDTWHSGVDGALPGVFMPPNPQLGEQHYQEYYPGHAEDQFQVTSLSARVRVPFGSFKHTWTSDVARTRRPRPRLLRARRRPGARESRGGRTHRPDSGCAPSLKPHGPGAPAIKTAGRHQFFTSAFGLFLRVRYPHAAIQGARGD